MAAQRPWWHEIVAGLSTEPIVPPQPSEIGARSRGIGASVEPQYGDEPAGQSSWARSTGGFISRKVPVWDPGSPAREWVRQATHDGRAIAIRRAQDAHAGRGAHVLGITPIYGRAPTPRASVTIGAHLVESRLHRAPDTFAPPHPALADPLSAPTRISPQPREVVRLCSFVAPVVEAPRPISAPVPSADQPGGAPPLPGPAPPGSSLCVRSPERDPETATLVAPRPLSPEGPVTIYGASAPPPSFPAIPLGTGAHAPGNRRQGLSAEPAVGCAVPAISGNPAAFKGKGAKHARLCAGPWASALRNLPPLPLTGAKRARAGLAATTLTTEDYDLVRRERAACALVAILPWAAAGFVLGDSEDMVSNRPVEETTSRLVRAIATYGASSVDAAHSALGRLMSWVVTHHPEARVVEGSHVSDFLAHHRPSAATLAALAWLRDHCGLAIPARGPTCRPYKGRPPASSHTKESLSLGSVIGPTTSVHAIA
ncbi:hypothetical protein AB1Y20_017972 [Prymnesium parvum]|uniref:Uncharacterized protein n=1 Tax=Prymnesium parvum TaxID=97485 RepID=A0AB34JNJ7_PRYPA